MSRRCHTRCHGTPHGHGAVLESEYPKKNNRGRAPGLRAAGQSWEPGGAAALASLCVATLIIDCRPLLNRLEVRRAPRLPPDRAPGVRPPASGGGEHTRHRCDVSPVSCVTEVTLTSQISELQDVACVVSCVCVWRWRRCALASRTLFLVERRGRMIIRNDTHRENLVRPRAHLPPLGGSLAPLYGQRQTSCRDVVP